MAQATATTDHGTIKRWVESRKGHPALVKRTEDRRGSGVLRIDFEPAEESLDEISWDQFFDVFEENHLAFLYQEKTASGRPSRFNKFVARDKVETPGAGDVSKENSGTRGGTRTSAAAAQPSDDMDEDDDADFDEEDDEDEHE
jgi:hypothetical protein